MSVGFACAAREGQRAPATSRWLGAGVSAEGGRSAVRS